MTHNPQTFPGAGFQLTEPYPNVRLWQPATDVLHDPAIQLQEPGCDEVYVGLPLGECGGVKMANEVIGKIAAERGIVYGNHEPTHGADANALFFEMGALFNRPPSEITPGSPYVISAHGAAPSVANAAREHGLDVFDVTCPLVARTHRAILSAKPSESQPEPGHVAYISFGKPDHPELVGAAGLAAEQDIAFTVVGNSEQAIGLVQGITESRIVVVGQTTNNAYDAESVTWDIRLEAKERGIAVKFAERTDVCHTVQDRQDTTRDIVGEYAVDSLVVVGSVNSKNTKSLAGVAARQADLKGRGLDIYLTNSWRQLPQLLGKVGVVSGASTLEQNVWGVVSHLNAQHGVQMVGKDTDKDITFRPVDSKTRNYVQSR